MERIIEIICNYFGITFEQMTEKTRKREIVKARQICHYFVKKYTKLTLKKIGLNIGNLSHAAVLNSIKSVNNQIDTYHSFVSQIIDIDRIILLKTEGKELNRLLIYDSKLWDIYFETDESYKIIRVTNEHRYWDEVPKRITIDTMIKYVID